MRIANFYFSLIQGSPEKTTEREGGRREGEGEGGKVEGFFFFYSTLYSEWIDHTFLGQNTLPVGTIISRNVNYPEIAAKVKSVLRLLPQYPKSKQNAEIVLVP